MKDPDNVKLVIDRIGQLKQNMSENFEAISANEFSLEAVNKLLDGIQISIMEAREAINTAESALVAVNYIGQFTNNLLNMCDHNLPLIQEWYRTLKREGN